MEGIPMELMDLSNCCMLAVLEQCVCQATAVCLAGGLVAGEQWALFASLSSGPNCVVHAYSALIPHLQA